MSSPSVELTASLSMGRLQRRHYRSTEAISAPGPHQSSQKERPTLGRYSSFQSVSQRTPPGEPSLPSASSPLTTTNLLPVLPPTSHPHLKQLLVLLTLFLSGLGIRWFESDRGEAKDSSEDVGVDTVRACRMASTIDSRCSISPPAPSLEAIDAVLTRVSRSSWARWSIELDGVIG